MNTSKREVDKLPLEDLWDDNGAVLADKGRQLSRADIRALLRLGLVTFVVADIGQPLRWITGRESYDFWKREAEPHLCEQTKAYLEDYPDEYGYFASEWRLQDGRTVVVLERCH